MYNKKENLIDYLVVGAGLYGVSFARQAVDAGKKVLVIDKRPHIAGNVYTENVEGIQVHKYGAHIFHTSNPVVWEYVNRFATFNRFTNSPAGRKLQRRTLQSSFQYVHIQYNVGRCDTRRSYGKDR